MVPRSTILILAGLIAMSAIAIDITLIALPATARAVGGDPAASGLIVAVYLAGFAPGQLIWGHAGDRFGRRRAVLAGLVAFLLATAACALASTYPGLLVGRFLQGVAGASGPVLSRAIVRDMATDAAAARVLALLTAILGGAPLLAPVLGAMLLEVVDWRSIFWFTAAYGALLLVLAVAWLPESRPAQAGGLAGGILARTREAFGDRDFRLGASLVAFVFGGYHTLLSLYSTLAIVELGFNEGLATWLFAAAAACFVAGSAISRRHVVRLGLQSLIRRAIVACAIGAVVAAAGAGLRSGAWLAVGIGGYMLGVGQVLPVATALALRHAGAAAGWAAALLGVLQIGAGALLSAIATIAAPAIIALPASLLACALAAFAVLALASRTCDGFGYVRKGSRPTRRS
jgi:DHA1 family bicyclomycin/chloramphenicol resistance-like MFS transporter